MSSLLEPVTIGGKIGLRNRVAMGSMTRNRCVDDYKPGPAQIRYYADRAKDGTGLIVGEGTFVDWTGSEWPWAPHMITGDHARAWRKVTDAVHEVGGKMYFQAWHAGRVQNDQVLLMKKKGGRVLAPSAIKAEGGQYRDLPGCPGHTENVVAIDDPTTIVQIYRQAVQLAKDAGFDGVELLAQGGYLLHTFMVTRANHRTDSYGGSVENRCRLTLEVVDAISQIYGGPEFICVKICPTEVYNDSATTFEEIQETYTYLIKELVLRRVGIINITRRGARHAASDLPRPEQYPLPADYDPVLEFGSLVKYPGSPTLLMANMDYTVEEADELIRTDKLDMITFGRPFIFNPDVVTRIRHGIPFATNDRGLHVFYGPYKSPDEGYNDWPVAGIVGS